MTSRAKKILDRTEQIPIEGETLRKLEKTASESARQIKEADFDRKTSKLREKTLEVWKTSGLIETMNAICPSLSGSEVSVDVHIGGPGYCLDNPKAESTLTLKWNIVGATWNYITVSFKWKNVKTNWLNGELFSVGGVEYSVNGEKIKIGDIDEKIAIALNKPLFYKYVYEDDNPYHYNDHGIG